MKLLSCLALASALTSVARAQQPAIFVDVGSVTLGFGVPSNGYAAAAPVGGLWNALDGDLLIGVTDLTTPPLLDINGNATAVTLTYDSLGTNFLFIEEDEVNTTGDDQALFDDIVYVNGASELRFNGLPAGVYDVYTYAMAPDDNTYFTSVDVIGSGNGAQDVGGDFSAGLALGVTHAFHTVTVVAGQPLIVMTDVAVTADSLNGIQILPTSGTGGLGTSYCGPAVVNSGGGSARMFVSGSNIAADNNVTLSCLDMPNFVFGFFLISPLQGFVAGPGGSAGNLCLGGSIGRYVGPGQIQNSGSAGEITLSLDLTNTPQPMGFVSIQAGETWNWQTWFRDSSMGVATSNFSDGIQVDFL